ANRQASVRERDDGTRIALTKSWSKGLSVKSTEEHEHGRQTRQAADGDRPPGTGSGGRLLRRLEAPGGGRLDDGRERGPSPRAPRDAGRRRGGGRGPAAAALARRDPPGRGTAGGPVRPGGGGADAAGPAP